MKWFRNHHHKPSFSSMEWEDAQTKAVEGDSKLSKYNEQEDEYLELINKIDSMP